MRTHYEPPKEPIRTVRAYMTHMKLAIGENVSSRVMTQPQMIHIQNAINTINNGTYTLN